MKRIESSRRLTMEQKMAMLNIRTGCALGDKNAPIKLPTAIIDRAA
jgi:hypothetical protein